LAQLAPHFHFAPLQPASREQHLAKSERGTRPGSLTEMMALLLLPIEPLTAK
jgi:hypothetical protein